MLSASIASFLLAASTALALPANLSSSSYPTDTAVKVILESSAYRTEVDFKSVDVRKHKSVSHAGPFDTLTVLVGKDANQDLRCQALDVNGKPIIGLRGANVDITFSDGTSAGNGGPWTFKPSSEVSRIICDPNFVKGNAEDFEVRVTLAGTDELATQTVFEAFVGRDESAPVGSPGPYTTVDIQVGKMLNPELRCKVIDAHRRKIVATRGENVDISFSDKDNGAWTFENGHSRRVSKIVCDESFVAQPQQ